MNLKSVFQKDESGYSPGSRFEIDPEGEVRFGKDTSGADIVLLPIIEVTRDGRRIPKNLPDGHFEKDDVFYASLLNNMRHGLRYR